MTNKFWFVSFFQLYRILLFISSFILINCANDPVSPVASVPVLTTASIGEISYTTARSGGLITSDGGSDIITCGICWCTDEKPTISDNKTTVIPDSISFNSRIIGLTGGTTYNVRAYATNQEGTGYGDVQSFMTTNYGTVTDIDGNTYRTILVGNQCWMAENLKVTRYRNGEGIHSITSNAEWAGYT